MFGSKRKKSNLTEEERVKKARKNEKFGMYNYVSSGQRSGVSDRGEMCSNAMNNAQKLAALQMLRDMRDED